MLLLLCCTTLLFGTGCSVFLSYRADVRMRVARGLLIEHLVLVQMANAGDGTEQFDVEFGKVVADHVERVGHFLMVTR